MDHPDPPRDPAEVQLALARWLSRQVAPPWAPLEPGALEHTIGSPVAFPAGALPPRGFGGVHAPRASAAARWAGPVYGTEVGPMAWADKRTLVCGGQDGQVFAMHLDERAQTWWPRLIGRQAGAITHLLVAAQGTAVAADSTGCVVLWNLKATDSHLPRAELVVADGQAIRHLALGAQLGIVAAAAQTGGACLWPLDASGRVEAPLNADPHAAPIVRLAFARDGLSIAGGSAAGELVLWREPGGATRLERIIPVSSKSIVLVEPWGPGAWLVVAADGAAIWHEDGGAEPVRRIWSAPQGQPPMVAACAHGERQLLAIAFADGTFALFDGSGGSAMDVARSHAGMVEALAFDDSGDRLVSLDGDGSMLHWDTAAGRRAEPIGRFHNPPPLTHRLALSPGGAWLAGAGDGDVLRLWRGPALAAQSPAQAIANAWTGPRKRVRLIAHGENAEQVATADEMGGIWLWPALRADAQAIRLEPSGADKLGCLEMSANGEQLFAGLTGGALLRVSLKPSVPSRAQTQARVHRGPGDAWINRIALDERRNLVASADTEGGIAIWKSSADAADRPLNAWKAHDVSIAKLAFMPGSGHLVSADIAGRVRWWAIDAAGLGGAHAEDVLQGDRVCALAAPAAGDVVLGGTVNGRLRRWRLGFPRTVGHEDDQDAHLGAVFDLAFLDEDRVLSAGADGFVRMWHVKGALRPEGPDRLPRTAHKQAVRKIALSPDRSHGASASDDGTVRVWTPNQALELGFVSVWYIGRPVHRILWHGQQVYARFDGGWCHWATAAEDPGVWRVQALVLQLDATAVLRLTTQGIELISDRPIATQRDSDGCLLPADPHTYGRLVFADAIDELSRPASGPRLFDAWQLAARLEWPALEDPPRRLRVRWADAAECERWLPREVRGAPPVRSAALLAADDFSPRGPTPAQTDPPRP